MDARDILFGVLVSGLVSVSLLAIVRDLFEVKSGYLYGRIRRRMRTRVLSGLFKYKNYWVSLARDMRSEDPLFRDALASLQAALKKDPMEWRAKWSLTLGMEYRVARSASKADSILEADRISLRQLSLDVDELAPWMEVPPLDYWPAINRFAQVSVLIDQHLDKELSELLSGGGIQAFSYLRPAEIVGQLANLLPTIVEFPHRYPFLLLYYCSSAAAVDLGHYLDNRPSSADDSMSIRYKGYDLEGPWIALIERLSLVGQRTLDQTLIYLIRHWRRYIKRWSLIVAAIAGLVYVIDYSISEADRQMLYSALSALNVSSGKALMHDVEAGSAFKMSGFGIFWSTIVMAFGGTLLAGLIHDIVERVRGPGRT